MPHNASNIFAIVITENENNSLHRGNSTSQMRKLAPTRIEKEDIFNPKLRENKTPTKG